MQVGAAKPYYKPREAARLAHRKGVYLIGRVVIFEDPVLAAGRPELAIKNPDGSVWRNQAGLGWTNPYDKRVWDYNVSIAEVAARAGFDEIQFDYVRFPTDGDVDSIVYPGKTKTPPGWVIAEFVHYATKRLKPLGVRVSTDLFGLAATRDLGIGQVPRRLAKYVDAVYPMVYPSHFGPGEYGLEEPNDAPGATVEWSLSDFRQELKKGKAELIPWLQDFSYGRTYKLADVKAQIEAARLMGARGYLLWNPLGIYTPALWRRRKRALHSAQGMAIGDVMRTRVVTVNTDDSARLAVLRMLEEGVGSVAVCDSGKLVGIFTERDVLGLAGEGTDLDAVRVGDVMTREPLTVDVGVPVLDAARLMGERKIRHLPVVQGDHLLGMVGIRDILGSLVERLWQSRDSAAHDTARSLFKN